MKKIIETIVYRIRLFIICKALGIRLAKWQQDFIIHGNYQFPTCRNIGKSFAVYLYAIVRNTTSAAVLYEIFLKYDPDFFVGNHIRSVWGRQEESYFGYYNLIKKIEQHGIKIKKYVNKKDFQIEIHNHLINKEHRYDERL